MQVELDDQIISFAEDQVGQGRFSDVNAVIRVAVELLQEELDSEHAKLEELRAMIDEGDADIAAGKLFTLDETMSLLEQDRREWNEAGGV